MPYLSAGAVWPFQHSAARRRLDRKHIFNPMTGVSTLSRPKAAVTNYTRAQQVCKFQHSAARRRLPSSGRPTASIASFNTQPPEGGWAKGKRGGVAVEVSTLSRPKAADGIMPTNCKQLSLLRFQHSAARRRLKDSPLMMSNNACFNTQPPEGGCYIISACTKSLRFQHSAARRRLVQSAQWCVKLKVSTLSRPKAADFHLPVIWPGYMFQHSAARRRLRPIDQALESVGVSTLSRPKAADLQGYGLNIIQWFQHSAARRRLACCNMTCVSYRLFQHSAARRRLLRLL